MKTKVLALAAIIMAAGTAVSFAANDNNDSKNNRPNKECKMLKKGEKGDRQAFNPFEGINLTADQQAKLDDLKSQCKMNGQNGQCDKKDDKAKSNEQKMDRRECKREYFAKVKTILTPEQYTTFLENMVVNAPGHDRGKMHMKDQRGQRSDKSQKGQRPDNKNQNK